MQFAMIGGEPGFSDAFLKAPEANLESIKQQFYRCQFSSLLSTIARVNLHQMPENLYVELQLIKANALYELQRIDDAKELLRTFGIFRHIECKASFNYGAGKLSYFEADYQAAEKYFAEIPYLTEDATLIFRSLLGLANVYFSQSMDHKLPALFAQLNQFREKVRVEDQISYDLLLGNFYSTCTPDKIMAHRYFQRALGASNHENWSYFVQRSLYGLAVLEQNSDRTAETHCILTILQAMTVKTESLFLRCLIQEKFKPHANPNKIEVDTTYMRVKIQGQWLALHEKPLIFNFFYALHQNKKFVTKKDLAKYLWPQQAYMARTHDPRIFDIAKRVRHLLETTSLQKNTLLSGRQGYKFVNSQEQNAAKDKI